MPSDTSPLEQKRFDTAFVTLLVMVSIKLLVHLYTNAFASYGIFRDELYYLACSHRLALGYVDQPPLSVYVLALSRTIFGESLFALRLVPAVAGGATVLVTGCMVRELGVSCVGMRSPRAPRCSLAWRTSDLTMAYSPVLSICGREAAHRSCRAVKGGILAG